MTENFFLPKNFTYHTSPNEDLLIGGADLVCRVSQETGFPDPTLWDTESLHQHTRERQARAHQTIIVTHTDPTTREEKIVAHSLLVSAQEPSWGNIPEIASYLEQEILAEAGSTAVDPAYQRLGIANNMRLLRMKAAQDLGLVVCVGLWDGSKSHLMYINNPEWHYLGSFLSSKTQRLLHRYVEARIFLQQI